MLTCPACGQENPDGAHYCNECAASLAGHEEDFSEDGAQAATPPVPKFLRRDSAEAEDAAGEDEPYLKFGFPWVWFQTVTQTRSQFIAQSVLLFVVVVVFALLFVGVGQAVCGIAYVLFFILVWAMHWAIGRSGAEPGY